MASLYDNILEIARSYMGIAAKEYIDRRCRIVSRETKPEDISIEKLDRLVAGIDMTAKVYMSEQKAREFGQRILDLKQRQS
jgi:hypothetical protein